MTTKTRRPPSACIAVVIGCSFLVQAGVASAQTQRAPNPEKLWEAFPLDPQTTAPAQPARPAEPPDATPPTAPHPEPADPTPLPAPPPAQSDAEVGSGPILVGGIASAVLLVIAAGLLLTRARSRRPAAPVLPETAQELVARAHALAKEAAECDMLLASERDKGVESVSKTADHEVPAEETTPSSSSSSGYAEIGERVAGVLSAAEAASEQIRADARLEANDLLRSAKEEAEHMRREASAYDSDTRAAVDTYATERRREAEEQVQKQLADAEAQARATREAAEEMARKIEEDGLQRGQTLRDESREVEDRLKKALVGLRRMTAQLEELVGMSAPAQAAAAQTDGGESLADALRPYGQRDEEMQHLVEER